MCQLQRWEMKSNLGGGEGRACTEERYSKWEISTYSQLPKERVQPHVSPAELHQTPSLCCWSPQGAATLMLSTAVPWQAATLWGSHACSKVPAPITKQSAGHPTAKVSKRHTCHKNSWNRYSYPFNQLLIAKVRQYRCSTRSCAWMHQRWDRLFCGNLPFLNKYLWNQKQPVGRLGKTRNNSNDPTNMHCSTQQRQKHWNSVQLIAHLGGFVNK